MWCAAACVARRVVYHRRRRILFRFVSICFFFFCGMANRTRVLMLAKHSLHVIVYDLVNYVKELNLIYRSIAHTEQRDSQSALKLIQKLRKRVDISNHLHAS